MKTPPLLSLHQVVPLLALVSLAFALTACSRSTSMPCSAELACPDGWKCSADGQACIQNLCGDNIVQTGEVCDDGNTNSHDGCNSTCSSNEECGNGYLDTEKNEKCDDGNTSSDDDCLDTCQIARCGDGTVSPKSAAAEQCDYGNDPKSCNLNCTIDECGDGIVNVKSGEECDSGSKKNTSKCTAQCKISQCGDQQVNLAAGEECDDGNTNDLDGCLNTCKRSRCGDGQVNDPTERCDDGNTKTETECPYGTHFCKLCNADCSAPLELEGSYCGDNSEDDGEACDDGNAFTEIACSSGTDHCTACNAACSEELFLSGSVCGNGSVEEGESCDDGNTESCGPCNALCTRRVNERKAKGYIHAVKPADLLDGETFTISDGLHTPWVFEFRKVGAPADGHKPVNIGSAKNAYEVANIISDAINAIPEEARAITASADLSFVLLDHDQAGGMGNQAILETVQNTGFIVSGMSGGTPYACSEGVGCAKDSDCASGLTCSNSTKLCTAP